MEFKKYSSITNHYDTKFLDLFKGSDFESDGLVIQEKIHGSNFRIVISVDNVQYGRRTEMLKSDEKFYNYQSVVNSEKWLKMVSNIQYSLNCDFPTYDNSNNNIEYIILYGELYGSGIQKEVYYKDYKDFIIFDISFIQHNGLEERLSPKDVRDFIEIHIDNSVDGLENYVVPTLARVKTLQEALDFNTKINSALSGKTNNEIEGVVIRNDGVPYFYNGERFIIKLKNTSFNERKSLPKEIKEKTDFELIALSYITENRMNNVFSKFGVIEELKDIGTYTRYFAYDAFLDYTYDAYLDYDDNSESCSEYVVIKEKEFKKSVNKRISEMLKKSILTIG